MSWKFKAAVGAVLTWWKNFCAARGVVWEKRALWADRKAKQWGPDASRS